LVDDVVGEDLALQQELVVALEVVERLLQRPGGLGHLGQFLRLQVVELGSQVCPQACPQAVQRPGVPADGAGHALAGVAVHGDSDGGTVRC
jgi:hypothetical protein